ncbi:MAG: hypothetical protein HZA27_02100, partial [Candidatus Omnitrophica bacterium]|nr:hypothetical protein [Candidatus Omnitrophota bacterium]
KEDKIIDEKVVDKLRNILITIGRVLINSDNTPDFYALAASDINLGLDYILIGSTLDIKKSYAGYLPWMEANKRYVIKFNLSPEAIGDTAGTHINYYDIKFVDFLSAQIAQRIAARFQQPELKKYFQVESSNGRFSNGDLIFEYSIKEIAKPEKQIEVKEVALDTIAYCLRTYEFKDFNNVEITNLALQDKLVLSQGAILARPFEQ